MVLGPRRCRINCVLYELHVWNVLKGTYTAHTHTHTNAHTQQQKTGLMCVEYSTQTHQMRKISCQTVKSFEKVKIKKTSEAPATGTDSEPVTARWRQRLYSRRSSSCAWLHRTTSRWRRRLVAGGLFHPGDPRGDVTAARCRRLVRGMRFLVKTNQVSCRIFRHCSVCVCGC